MILCASSTLQQTSTEQDACVYVLECEGGRWYVGFSHWPRLRIENHFCGTGAVFTQKYRPIRVKEIKPAIDELDEYKLWRKLAERYGYQYVGGYNQFLCDQMGFEWPFYRIGLRPKWVKQIRS